MQTGMLLLLSALLLVAAGTTQQKNGKKDERIELPPGSARELVQSSCNTSCHGLKVIVSAHKTQAEWAKTVNDMIQRGAPVFPEEISPITKYLAEAFPGGEKPTGQESNPARGSKAENTSNKSKGKRRSSPPARTQ